MRRQGLRPAATPPVRCSTCDTGRRRGRGGCGADDRNNWLFAGSLRAGQRAAAVTSLIQSARMNGHDPYAYLRDVMARLIGQKAASVTSDVASTLTFAFSGGETIVVLVDDASIRGPEAWQMHPKSGEFVVGHN